MNVLAFLMPLALGLGLAGLAAFFWCMRSHQFEDLEGAGWRVLSDDDLSAGQKDETDLNRRRNQ